MYVTYLLPSTYLQQHESGCVRHYRDMGSGE